MRRAVTRKVETCLSNISRAVITVNEFLNKDEKNKQNQAPALQLVMERRKTATCCGPWPPSQAPLEPTLSSAGIQHASSNSSSPRSLAAMGPHPKIHRHGEQGSACLMPGVLRGWHRVSRQLGASSSSAAGWAHPPWEWMEEEGPSQHRRFPKRATQSNARCHPNTSQIQQLAWAKMERFILTFPKSISPIRKGAFAYGGRWPGVFAGPTAPGQRCCPQYTAFLQSQQLTQCEVGMHHGCSGAGKLQRNLLPDPQGGSEGAARLQTHYLQIKSMQDPA